MFSDRGYPGTYPVRNLIRDPERLPTNRDLQPAHTRLTEKGQGAAVLFTRPSLKEENAAGALIDDPFHGSRFGEGHPGEVQCLTLDRQDLIESVGRHGAVRLKGDQSEVDEPVTRDLELGEV